MKILQINVVCGVGSTGRITTDLYKVLEQEGHECLIAYGRGSAPKGINGYRIGSNADMYLHVAKTRVFDKTAFGSKKATEEFIKVMDNFNADIIHLHNLHGYYINIEILFDYLKRTNKPVVWSLHDCWSFTGHCSHFDYVGCEKWKTGCYQCVQKKEYPSSLFIDNSKLNYDKKKKIFTSIDNLTVVAPSKWIKEQVEQSFLNKFEVKVINNGIDLSTFKERKNGKITDKFNIADKFIILGAATTWDSKKGLKDFIKLSKIINKDSVIVLVGLNEEQIKGLPENIIGIKRTDCVNEMVELYSEADVFVNASVEESFGLVTVEAMACGVPVIVYNSTASPELVPPTCGFVVEKNNIEQVKAAINVIRKNGKDHYSMSCINEVNLKYNKVDIYEQYISLYKDKLKRD